jgi:hypothetical protein
MAKTKGWLNYSNEKISSFSLLFGDSLNGNYYCTYCMIENFDYSNIHILKALTQSYFSNNLLVLTASYLIKFTTEYSNGYKYYKNILKLIL